MSVGNLIIVLSYPTVKQCLLKRLPTNPYLITIAWERCLGESASMPFFSAM